MGDYYPPGYPGGQNQLSITRHVSGSDLLIINKGSAQRYRAISVDDFARAIGSQFGNNWLSQYFAPNATGFTITLGPVSPPTPPPYPYPPYPPYPLYPLPPIPQWTQDIWALVQPVAGYAAGTVVLPPNTYLRDKQKIFMFFTQSVTTLSFTLNGATTSYGLPTTIATNGYFTLQYDLQTNSWFRVA